MVGWRPVAAGLAFVAALAIFDGHRRDSTLRDLSKRLRDLSAKNSNEPSKRYVPKLAPSVSPERFRDCLLQSLPAEPSIDDGKRLFASLSKTTQECLGRFTRVSPASPWDLFHMGRFGELKRFIAPANESAQKEACVFLTIGIGGDVQVEKEFKAKYPTCGLFGIEPSPDQYKGFAEFGTVINSAVGVGSGSVELTLREGKQYVKKLVNVVPLHELLEEHAGTRTVLYSTMDIEGFEYELIEALREGRRFHEEGVKICQIDAEFHSLSQMRPKDFNFAEYFRALLKETAYLPVTGEDFFAHRKMTLVLHGDPFCERIFAFSNLFDPK